MDEGRRGEMGGGQALVRGAGLGATVALTWYLTRIARRALEEASS